MRVSQRREMSPGGKLVFGIIFIIIGVLLLKFSISSNKTYKEKDATFIPITSKVVSYATNSDGLQAIIVEYEVDGNKYTKQSNTYSSMPKSIGTEVGVKYNPDNPNDAIWEKDSTGTILFIVSVVFIVAGAIVIISRNKMTETQY